MTYNHKLDLSRKLEKTGEYKIRPYKGFLCEGRGEPRVHPEFSARVKLEEKIKTGAVKWAIDSLQNRQISW